VLQRATEPFAKLSANLSERARRRFRRARAYRGVVYQLIKPSRRAFEKVRHGAVASRRASSTRAIRAAISSTKLIPRRASARREMTIANAFATSL
jgi:hypothetical protein